MPMTANTKIPNRLINEKSPYLLQHAYNPVDWFPWCNEAFDKAKVEDKPIFLSIGYATCHWCHVFEHESFEDEEVARILNQHFISIKVDREIRPDIDSIYMSVCQALTGGGGWPLSIFMTPDQRPFFAGTYFPKTTRGSSYYGHTGFIELLEGISQEWSENRERLLDSANRITEFIKNNNGEKRKENKDKYNIEEEQIEPNNSRNEGQEENIELKMIGSAFAMYCHTFDERYGGFGNAPKFPSAHNLLFLMDYYERFSDQVALYLVEKTLIQMYKGGLFDHIGGGFSRYSTDARFLVPHFEKMLYDNALLMMAYGQAFHITGKNIYRIAAERTADYILREMTCEEGGFYSAQDADSEGEEGKYYVFTKEEVLNILGESEGENFCSFYDISEQGNFEGKNIPNLLHHDYRSASAPLERGYGDISSEHLELSYDNEDSRARLYSYRQKRTHLGLDDKMLTSWNALMIGAFTVMYRVFGKEEYLIAAKRACRFIQEYLTEGETLHVGFRDGTRLLKGFMEDYAYYIYSLIHLYDVTLDQEYLMKSKKFMEKAIRDFFDHKEGGFYLYGNENEQLISRPREVYDGALPSGNSVMAYNLVRLSALCPEEGLLQVMEKQISYMTARIEGYPAGSSFFLSALLHHQIPAEHVVCVLKSPEDMKKRGWSKDILSNLDFKANVIVLHEPTEEYPLTNNEVTFYICRDFTCLPPVNKLSELQE